MAIVGGVSNFRFFTVLSFDFSFALKVKSTSSADINIGEGPTVRKIDMCVCMHVLLNYFILKEGKRTMQWANICTLHVSQQ